jgi:erythronate-4-phosphate dehydrogenase
MRLLADENMVGLDALPAEVEVRTLPGRSIDAAALRGVDALWVRSVTRVDRELLRGSRLRFVGTATAGVEHVDRDLLCSEGIAFSAAPGANAMAVVEYVLAACLALAEPWQCLERGGRLGIVGFGHVGRRLARFGTAMGWRVAVCDPWLQESAREAGAHAADFADLAEVLRCDVISLHCSLHGRAPWPSLHLLDAARLASLDSGQWLINASRGAVVDNAALLRRLGEGAAPSVVLDVFEGEPDLDARLLGCDDVRLVTPHIAGYSWDAKWAATQRLWQAMAGSGLVDADVTLSDPSPAPAALSGEWSVRTVTPVELLLPVYDPRRDDAKLRRQFATAGAARGRAFDRLRRDYPLRRELSALLDAALAASEMNVPGLPHGVERFASALLAARREQAAARRNETAE